jgi:predicted metal-dependent phosphoesterase TrpH
MDKGYRQYDLHCHSTASDGELTPSELVRYAVENGVEVLALTDHDVTDGLAEAAEEAQRHNLQLVSGVEISVSWNSCPIHIIGLDFDANDAILQRGLTGLRRQRGERAEEMARRLARAGIGNALEGAEQYANGRILSRTHFAQFLYQSGHVKTLQEAFDRYIGAGKKAYVSCEWISLDQAVRWITAAGGHAVIAHPARYNLSATRLRTLIHEFKEAGGEALEVISGNQDVNVTRNMADYAERFELYASVGSDYHGPGQPWRRIGRLPQLPAKCAPVWQLWT